MSDPESARRLLCNARREAVFTLLVWAVALVWSVGYCAAFGYVVDEPPAEFRMIAGMPDWVFLGIFTPWVLCFFTTIVFCLVGMRDDDLGAEAQEQGAGHGH
jgi:hypothetical protein